MSLVPSFVDLLQPLSCAMTCPTFDSLLTVLTGWVFARRRTVTGMILAAGAAVGAKHHSAYHRLFAAARWSLDELGLDFYHLGEDVHGPPVGPLSQRYQCGGNPTCRPGRRLGCLPDAVAQC